jgi:large subunit ribosomal protein L31
VKPDIHPDYRPVVFQDTSSGLTFLTRSTIETRDTIEWEGETYPLAKVDISSESHPFYTGKQILVDSGGRVERFRRRYAKVGVDTDLTKRRPQPEPSDEAEGTAETPEA